jgi:NADPH2:quinone reductase
MKAVCISQVGGPEVMKYEEVPIPTLNEEEALVRIKSIGVNFIDIYQRSGLYPVELPYVLGLEATGVIEKINNVDSGFKPGDRVAFCGVPGCYAELTAVPYNQLVSLPYKIEFDTGATLMLQGMTAHYLTKDTYNVHANDTCLIHAAAGGTGQLLVQMAKLEGAFVIGTVSNSEKAKIALKAGADKVIIYTEKDFVSEVMDLTNGKGVNVVYDSVGKTTFEKSLDCLSKFGLFVSYGQSSGSISKFDLSILNKKGSLFITRPSLFHYIDTWSELNRRANDVFDWFLSKKITNKIDNIFSLKDAAEAHTHLQNRKSMGKILITPNQSDK